MKRTSNCVLSGAPAAAQDATHQAMGRAANGCGPLPRVVASLVWFLLASAAGAQLHDFYNLAPPFFGGYLADFANDTIDVDQDGDGITDETFDLPTVIQAQPGTLLQFSLSPTQEVLYSVRSTQTASALCGGNVLNVEVNFHRLVVSPGGNSMTQLTSGTVCLRGVLSSAGPLYFDPDRAAAVRTAVVVAAPEIGSQQLLFVDLVNGGSAVDGLNYEPNVNLLGGLTVSPAGNALFIQHDSTVPRWRVVDLCASRVGGSGTSSTPTGGAPTTAQLLVSGTDLFTRVTTTPSGGSATSVDIAMNNCFGAAPPQLEELTVQLLGGGSGGVISTPAGISCGATCTASFLQNTPVTLRALAFPPNQFAGWGGDCASAGVNALATVLLDQARNCTATIVGPQVAVSKSGPAQAAAGVNFDYTLIYSNTGDGPATNVVVRDTLPAQARFVSASSGGTTAGGVVTWNVGTVGPGQSSQLTLTVDSCTAGTLVNDTYDISASGLIAIPGTPAVSTSISGGPSQGDVTASMTSVPSAQPLLPGGVITHTITLVNNTVADIPDLFFSFNLGAGVTLDQFVDAGGGTFNQVSAATVNWLGQLPASTTLQLVLTVVVDECLSADENHFNFGNQINLASACGTTLASIPASPPTPLQRPVEIDTTLRNLVPVQVPAPLMGEIATMRSTDALEVTFTVSNRSQQVQTNVVATLPVPAGLEAAMEPPFLAPTDLGAAWDPVLEELSWTGDLQVGQTAVVTVALRQGSDVSCRSPLVGSGSVGTCNNLFTSSQVLRFADLPRAPYLQGVDEAYGLFVWEPGADLSWRELLCFQPEISQSVEEGIPGELWVGGLPAYRADPAAGELEFQTVAFPANPTFVRDVAWLGTSGEALFSSSTELVARDVSAGTDRTVAPGPFHWNVEVDSGGDILLANGFDLVRLDAATGAQLQQYVDANLPLQFEGLTIDSDGDYLTTSFVPDGSGGFLQQLVEINPTSGAMSVVLSDLGALIGVPTDLFGGVYLTRLAVDSAGLIYGLLRPSYGAFLIDRTSPSATPLAALGGSVPTPSPGIQVHAISDLTWIETIAATTDLELTWTAPASTSVGQPAAVQLMVHNASTVDASNVHLSLAAPDALALSAAMPGNGTCTGSPFLRCDLGTLTAGGAVLVDLVATPNTGGFLHLLAHTKAHQPEGDASDNVVVIPIEGLASGGFDLGVQITDAVDPISAGEALLYQLTVNNAGPDAVPAAQLSLDLPDASQLGAVDLMGATCSGSDPLVCTAPASLAVGGQWSGTVEIVVDSSVSDGSALVALASVSAPGNDLSAGNDTASASTTIANRADVSVLVLDDADPVAAGTPVGYEVSLHNDGPADSGVNLTIDWSGNAALQLAGGCVAAGQQATCDLGTVASGAVVVQPVTLQLAGPGPVTVQAVASALASDPDSGNDSAAQSTAVLTSNLENIDPLDSGEQWADGTDVGLIDLEPNGHGGPGVEVTDTRLAGWMWGENIGWCSMNCEQAGTCGEEFYEVANDGRGALSGFAHCEAGRLSFSCTSTNDCATQAYGVTIDENGLFAGDAFGPLGSGATGIGWVDFDLPAGTRARTTWQAPFFADGFEGGDTTAWSSSSP